MCIRDSRKVSSADNRQLLGSMDKLNALNAQTKDHVTGATSQDELLQQQPEEPELDPNKITIDNNGTINYPENNLEEE